MQKNIIKISLSFLGDINDESFAGSNKLLVDGAKCIISANDILKYYPSFKKIPIKTQNIKVPDEYKTTYDALGKNGKYIDEIVQITKIDTNKILSDLTMLEILDLVKELPGKLFKQNI